MTRMLGTYAERMPQSKRYSHRRAPRSISCYRGSRPSQRRPLLARTDFTTPRLFVEADLSEGAKVALSAPQANYLVNVLRVREGARVLLFNGRDGEYAALLEATTRKGA